MYEQHPLSSTVQSKAVLLLLRTFRVTLKTDILKLKTDFYLNTLNDSGLLF
jgi:hypothetical protein